MKNLFKMTMSMAVATYFILVSHIPFFELLDQFHIELFIWCVLAFVLFVIFVTLLFYPTKKMIFLFLLTSSMWHLAMFNESHIEMSFKHDSCLDSGGIWIKNSCLQ